MHGITANVPAGPWLIYMYMSLIHGVTFAPMFSFETRSVVSHVHGTLTDKHVHAGVSGTLADVHVGVICVPTFIQAKPVDV